MAETTRTTDTQAKVNGLFVRGVVVSNSAKVFKRKDGTGQVVCVRHELALQPGLAIYEQYPDLNAGRVKVQGEVVTEYPKLPEFEQVTLRVLRWQERDGRLVIKEAELVSAPR